MGGGKRGETGSVEHSEYREFLSRAMVCWWENDGPRKSQMGTDLRGNDDGPQIAQTKRILADLKGAEVLQAGRNLLIVTPLHLVTLRETGATTSCNAFAPLREDGDGTERNDELDRTEPRDQPPAAPLPTVVMFYDKSDRYDLRIFN